MGIALHAGGGAGEDHSSSALGEHTLDRLLGRQERAIGGDADRALNGLGVELHQRSAHPGGRVVDHQIRRAEIALDRTEHFSDLCGVAGVTGVGLGRGFARQVRQLFRVAGGQRDCHALFRQEPGAGGGKPAACADDKCRFAHVLSPRHILHNRWRGYGPLQVYLDPRAHGPASHDTGFPDPFAPHDVEARAHDQREADQGVCAWQS